MSLDPSRQYTYGGDEQQPQEQAQGPPYPQQLPRDAVQTQQPTYGPGPVRPPPHMLVQQHPQPLPQQATSAFLDGPSATWQQYQPPVPAPPALQPIPSRWPTHLSITLPQDTPAGPRTTSPLSLPYSASHSITSPLPGFAAVPYFPDGSPFPSPGLSQVVSPGVHSNMSSALVSPPLQEYFQPYQPDQPTSFQPPLAPPTSTATSPSKRPAGSSRSTSTGSQGGRPGAKTTRQQFTACGACKHRRVGCDLKDRQAAAERQAKKGGKKTKVSCSNCLARGINCVDEFAPIKAAKQLRRGKRISEIENLYGMSGQEVANPDDSYELASPTKDELDVPQLGQGFWQSDWLRGFVKQRPVIDLNNPSPELLLHHVLYAFAVSCGIDENGLATLDDNFIPAEASTDYRNEVRRQARSERLKPILEAILREIDSSAALRRPQWDIARALLLFLPLIKEYLSPLEVQAISDAAYSHVSLLAKDRLHRSDVSLQAHLADFETLWHAYVSEALTSGLEGRRIHLDYGVVERFSRLARPDGLDSGESMLSRRMTAPSHTASQVVRLLHPFLAQPQEAMSNETFSQSIGLLESGWNGAQMLAIDESMASDASDVLEHWLNVFVVYHTLHTILQNQLSASASHRPGEEQRLRQLVESSHAKCSTLSKVLVDVLRNGTGILAYGSNIFEDAIYYVGRWLIQSGGSDQDVGICISVLSESPWCLSKAWSRIAELRDGLARRSTPPMQQWSASPSMTSAPTNQYIHPPMLLATSVKTEADDTPRMGYQAQQTQQFYYPSYNQPGDPAPFNQQFWRPSDHDPQQRT